MTDAERRRALKERKVQKRAWHQPPTFEYIGTNRFLVTATCYEHKSVIGKNASRMAAFESDLIELCDSNDVHLYAWCVLPNHYHILIKTDNVKRFKKELGKLHGRTSFRWNLEDGSRGRKVWFRCLERKIRGPNHFWAALNYVHNNPLKHGYVKNWTDWPYSSARDYLDAIGRGAAVEIWRNFPVLDFGKDWDP